MTLRHLKIFLSIYETGSTTAAAEQLFISQPTVSVALRELEEHYGVRMFERYAKHLYVTPAGQQMYQYAKHLVNLMEEAEDAICSQGEAGTLRVGSSITIATRFLPEYVRRFKELYPQMQVQVKVDNTDTIARMVLDNQIDLGLVEGQVHSPYIQAQPYSGDRLVLVCSPRHPYAGFCRVAPEVLAVEDMLLREKGSAGRDLFDSLMERRGVRIEPAWESVSTQALVRAVQADLGVAVLPYYLVQEAIEQGTVTAVPLEGVDSCRRYSLIVHKSKFHSAALDAFLELCRSYQEADVEVPAEHK